MQFITIDDPRRAEEGKSVFALWQLGFRPFYLLASGFAAISILLWTAQVTGWLPRPYLAGTIWHAHEMVFGYALAVIVGFLFTAGRNWTGLPTPTGRPLQLLAALWVLGRILVLTPYGWAAAVVNVAFPVSAAIALAIPFWQARVKRNYFFPGLLLLVAFAQLAVHLSQLHVIATAGWPGVQVGLDVVLLIMSVMAGRVVPMFTNNGAPGAGARSIIALEFLANGSIVALLIADILPGPHIAAYVFLTAIAHLVRWLLWKPWMTLKAPMVLVLHGAYLWIPAYLALRACADLGWIASNLATHALAVGAVGGLTIGMMTRTARGHTGRPLKPGTNEKFAYASIFAAAAVRVFVPMVAPAMYLIALQLAALLWAAGFLSFFAAYWPMLTRSRIDGKPG